jgi:hypothetical protein
MGATWVGRVAAALAAASMMLIVRPSRGDVPQAEVPAAPKSAESASSAEKPPTAAPAPAPEAQAHAETAAPPAHQAPAPAQVPNQAQPPAGASDPARDASAPTSTPAAVDLGDPQKVRADAEQRLKQLADTKDAENPSANKALSALLEERIQLVKAWEEASKARQDAEHPPAPTPEHQLADAKAAHERTIALMEQSLKRPEVLLPRLLRDSAAPVDDKLMVELKDAIDACQGDLKEWTGKLDKLKDEPAEVAAARLAALRTERDKAHMLLVAVRAQRAEREKAVKAAKSAKDRAAAEDRLINYQWERRVAEERLRGLEAKIALSGKLTELRTVVIQQSEARVKLSRRALELLQKQYTTLSERHEAELKKAADDQEKQAAKSNDPLERFRAMRSADLYQLEMDLTRFKKEAATSPDPCLEDMVKAADAAETEFQNTKKLLEDGRISRLDALRLNSDFRRIVSQRASIVQRELELVKMQMAKYENALSAVEVTLLNDVRDDRFEYFAMLERLPKSRHAEAEQLCVDLEQRHLKLLDEMKAILLGLATGAEQTHEQILRRIKVLDEEYGFIRTHLILVRDREPIGLATCRQACQELYHLRKGVVRLALELGDRSFWRPGYSIEFRVALVIAVLLPLPLCFLRRMLARRNRESVAATPPGGA